MFGLRPIAIPPRSVIVVASLGACLSAPLACDEPDYEAREVIAQSADAELLALSVVPNPADDNLRGRGRFDESDTGGVTFDMYLRDCPEGLHRVLLHSGSTCGVDASEIGDPWPDPATAEIGWLDCPPTPTAPDAESTEAQLVVTSPGWSLEGAAVNNPGGRVVVVAGIDPRQIIACAPVSNADHKFEFERMQLTANPAAGIAGRASFDVLPDYRVKVAVELTGCPAGKHELRFHEGPSCGTDGGEAKGVWDPYEAGTNVPPGEANPARLGDIGYIECAADGSASLGFETGDWTLVAGEIDDPVGKTLIIAGLDPNNRVACGPIVARSPSQP